MIRIASLFIAFTLISSLGIAQDIKQFLFELPDVSFKTIHAPSGFEKAYELKIKQALDHNDPSKGHFYQRVFLSHRNNQLPMVIVTNGYQKEANSVTEVATLLNANQLNVEHRYFGKSVPDSMDYQFLNLEQATADLHRINELFKPFYQGKWISTGISKGGQTTLIYRYKYPNDVDLSIPYVAPINNALEDKRIYAFLDTVGTDECRQKIKAIQHQLLQKRDSIIPLLRWYSYGAKYNFTYLNLEQAFEYAVLEFPFSFWQWGSKCENLPESNLGVEKLLYYMVGISGVDFFSDESMEKFASHYYQAGSQMGYYSYQIDEFKTELKALNTEKNPSAIFMPLNSSCKFDNSIMLEAEKWLKKNGNQIIYINGNSDTWSATAIRPEKNIDALWYFLKGMDHGKARIASFSEEEYAILQKKIEEWIAIKIPDLN